MNPGFSMRRVKVSHLCIVLLIRYLALVTGIKLEEVWVPQYGLKDGEQILKCHFDLETDSLLVLKWYKDGHEFFRITPESARYTMVFPVDGVTVDLTKSNMNQIVLKDIAISSSGNYKCEISADRPSFRTLSGQGHMVVIAPPVSGPDISGVHPIISVGETLYANCSSFHSKPAAFLMFYINEEKAEFADMIEYLSTPESNGLETSTLGLTFRTHSRHFRNGILELKCTATIGNVYGVSKFHISEANLLVQSFSGNRGQLSSDSGSLETHIRVISELFFFPVYIVFQFGELNLQLLT